MTPSPLASHFSNRLISCSVLSAVVMAHHPRTGKRCRTVARKVDRIADGVPLARPHSTDGEAVVRPGGPALCVSFVVPALRRDLGRRLGRGGEVVGKR